MSTAQWIVIGLIYFVPTFVAVAKSHHERGKIFVFNLFLGWTVIFWIAAIMWAVSRPSGKAVKPIKEEKICPDCAETIKATAKVCRFCNYRFEAMDTP